MVNGRLKGNNYENAICLVLSRWLVPSLPKLARIEQLPFRRRTTSITPLEGHWNGAGDILHRPDLPHPWPFCVECKRIEGWTFDGAFNEKWPVWSWWSQACAQSKRSDLAPLLVCSRRYQPDYAMLRMGDALCLGLERSRTLIVLQGRDREAVVVALLTDLVLSNPALLANVSTASKSRKPSTTTRKMTSA